MTRNEHLEWCTKCTNRKWTYQQGFVCELTSAIADFAGTCRNFKLDAVVQEKTDKKDFLAKYNNSQFTLTKTKSIKWKKYANTKSLPEQFYIRNSKFELVKIVSIILPIGIIATLAIKQVEYTLVTIIIGIGPLLIALLIWPKINKISKDRDPKITINKSGLAIGTSRKMAWNNIETYLLIENNKSDNNTTPFLLIKPLNNEEIITPINHLELSPSEIDHLVELYKSLHKLV